MTTRRSLATLAVVLLILVVGVGALYAARSQSPAGVLAVTATPTATVAPAPTSPSPAASPTPQGLYMSKKLGFALELPPPWQKAACGNLDPLDFPGATETIEPFTSAGPEERIGHVGPANDRITVTGFTNTQGRTPRQLAEASFSGSPNATIKDVTLAGRPAAEAEARSPGGDQFYYFLADGDRILRVGYMIASEPPADTATMQRIVRSFRLLSTPERQALPDPMLIAAAAPTPQALAALLKSALESKDAAALERLLGPCVSVGGKQAGVSNLARQRYISQLREQFTAGLIVIVDATAIRTEEGFYGTTVRSRWTAVPAGEVTPPPTPGSRTYEVDLVLGRTTGGYFWRGTLVDMRPPG